MVLSADIRITPRPDGRCTVRWTSDPAAVSWLFVDGSRIIGPHAPGVAEREAIIRLAVKETAAIELHDVSDTSEPVAATYSRHNTRPMLHWLTVPGIYRYRIYHRQAGGSESMLMDKRYTNPPTRLSMLCPVELYGQGGVWHFLRVETVDEYGNESTRQSWRYFVTEPPARVSNVTVTAGSGAGLYNISWED